MVPNRFPFRDSFGNVDCCDGRTYQTDILSCCFDAITGAEQVVTLGEICPDNSNYKNIDSDFPMIP